MPLPVFLFPHPPPRFFERSINGVGTLDIGAWSTVPHGIIDPNRAVEGADRMRGKVAFHPIC